MIKKIQTTKTGRGGVGVGVGVKFLHIEGKIASVVHSHPPSHYIRTHSLGWLYTGGHVHYLPAGDVHYLPTVCRKEFVPSLPCATCQAISMHVSVPSWPALSFFSVCNTSPPPSLQLAFCGMSPLTSSGTRFVRCESHDPTSPLLTVPLGQHMPLFQLWNFPAIPARRVFPGKRNDIRQGLAASDVNSHWLVNPRRIAPEKTQWKWARGMWQDSCDARFLFEKKHGMWERSAASHLNLQSHWAQEVFLLQKTHGIWKGFRDARFSWKKIRNPGAVGRVSFDLQSQWTHDAFYLRKHKEPGGVGTAHFSFKNARVKMKARFILHEKTQRFLRGRHERHGYLQSKWSRRILHEKTQRFFRGRWRRAEGVYTSKEQR